MVELECIRLLSEAVAKARAEIENEKEELKAGTKKKKGGRR